MPRLLSLGLFLVIFAYEAVKPARASLLVTFKGTAGLTSAWLIGTVALLVIVALYNRLIARWSRTRVLPLSLAAFALTLLVLRVLLQAPSPWMAIALYVWADVFGVVMVEQLWAIGNDYFDDASAKASYGLLSLLAIVGGMAGSAVAIVIIPYVGTENLLYIGVAAIAGILPLTIPIIRFQRKSPRPEPRGAKLRQPLQSKDTPWSDLVEVLSSRYLTLVLVSVLFTQIVSNVIDYQFTGISEQAFTTTDTRSVFLGESYFFINLLGAAVSLATPLLYNTLGVKGSFLTLPVLNLAGTLLYLLFPLNPVGIGLKLTDKGFNYSLDRTSKELFYIRVPGRLKFKAKAIIDMFAYRFSKSVSSVLLLGFAAVRFAGAVTAGNCLILGLLLVVRVYLLRHYRETASSPQA